MSDTQDRVLRMRVSARWLAALDEWRRKQPDLPGRSEAVRRLVATGLKAGGERKPRKTEK